MTHLAFPALLLGQLSSSPPSDLEQMPTTPSCSQSFARRSYGALVVGLLGALGGILSALVNQHLPWRLAYVVGGCIGLALLGIRWQMREPTVFAAQRDPAQARGSLLEIACVPALWAPSLAWVLVGAPLTLVVAYFVWYRPLAYETASLTPTKASTCCEFTPPPAVGPPTCADFWRSCATPQRAQGSNA